MNRKIVNIALAGGVLMVGGFAILNLGGNEEAPAPIIASQEEVEKEKNPIMKLNIETVGLGEVSETVFENSTKPFDVFWSSDERAEHYGFFKEDQQNQLIIVPTSTKYEVDVKKLEVDHKTITVNYTYGTPKIPRVVGHVKKIEARAYVIDFRAIDSAVYKLNLTNELDETSQEEELDFTKPFYRSQWEVKNLTWGDEDQLVFAGNLDGKWDLWGAKVEKDAEPIKLTTRHEDLPLNTMSTLGAKNLNVPIPEYNNKRKQLIYHADQDIFEVSTRGTKNYPLTIKETANPEVDGLSHFENAPQSTYKGDYIYFRRIYDPITSELWRMNHDGTNKVKVQLPQMGYVEEFDISPKDDQIAVLMSNRSADVMNGRSNLWVIPTNLPEASVDGNTPQKAKRLTTVGHLVKDIHFASDNKRIVFSMKEHSTTSDLSTNVWSVKSNNTDLTQLTPQDGYMDVLPVWSPNGKKIAYLSGDGKSFNLWTMDANGENRKSLNPTIRVEGKPLWSKDGSRIYVSDVRGNIFEFDLTEGKVYRVVKGF